jgi:hypothetical protein
MPLLRKVEGKTTVTRRKAGVTQKVSDTTQDLGEVETLEYEPMANVGMSLGRTWSSNSVADLADYESVKIDVSLHAPCRVEEVDEAMDEVSRWVQERLEKVAEELGLVDG